MKPIALFSILSIAVVISAFAADKPDDASIHGDWQLVKGEVGGSPLGDDVVNKITMKLDGGKYEVMAENVDKGTYAVNAAVKPKTIDVTGVEGPNAGRKFPAIYEVRGDTLRICYDLGGNAHPTEFKSPKGTQHFLATYKRKKPGP